MGRCHFGGRIDNVVGNIAEILSGIREDRLLDRQFVFAVFVGHVGAGDPGLLKTHAFRCTIGHDEPIDFGVVSISIPFEQAHLHVEKETN